MRTRSVLPLMVVFAAISIQLHAQTVIGRQKVDQFPVNAAGSLTYGLTWLPGDYATSTNRYPLIIFLHGMGEAGTGVADLHKLISTALPQKIANGWDPAAVNPLNNQNYKFIVVSPQAPVWSYGFPSIQYILNDVVARYRVDTTRIYFTGLSAGGAGTNASVTNGAALATRVAAIVPVAAAGTNTTPEGAAVPLIGGTYGVKVWNVCGTADQFWNLTLALTDSINNASPAPQVPAIVTGLQNLGHTSEAWNTAYDPNWRTNTQNLNIYEWMLKYSRSNSTATNQPPQVNAGNDQAIYLPVTTTTLSGTASDPDGSVASYQWTKVSGPAQGSIATPQQPQTSVNNLTAGSYVFRLRVTDNAGATAYDDVTVTVLPAPTYTSIPAKIEAENWSAMQGVLTENTMDAGGGQNVGWIDQGDWMDYNINATTAGTYTLKLRIATPNSGAQLQVRKADGTTLTTVNLPITSGYQNWQTISTALILPQGQQTIRIISTAAPGWNINWLEFEVPVTLPPGIAPTANSFTSFVPYNATYRYGANPGWYGYNWSAQQVATLAMGNPAQNIKGAGVKSLRMPIYDDFVTTWGLQSLLGDFQYYSSLGGAEFTAFVGMPHATHRDTTVYPGSPEQSKTFLNLYEPIWLDSAQTQINPNNHYAKYLFDVVQTYGDFVRFWEIVNEPDYTYSSAGWTSDINPPLAGSWFDHDPTPEELVNLRAPIEHYVRMLRISWEVIKKLQPNDYVCTGGIAYLGFLDAILRNTDNPVDGSVTAQYPLKGGAYFDVLSFHNYPMYNLSAWNNNIGGFDNFRHSDAAAEAFIMVRDRLDSLARVHGYNNQQFPRKQYICTETGVSRIMNGEEWGSNEGQKNYLIKAQIASQRHGVSQVYWYQVGDGQDANFQYDQMGMYYYFGNDMPFTATKTDQGIAMKTTSDLLFGASYDAARTTALNLPANVGGSAFKKADNTYIYILWAKTHTDLSETTAANYSFPAGLVPSGLVKKKLWNYSETGTTAVISSTALQLNGTPAFFEVAAAPPVNQPPVVNAGADQSITLPVNSVSVSGTASDPDGTITTYVWTKISGPSASNITTPNAAATSITGLVQGSYQFSLTVTDNNGASASDTLVVTVHPAPNVAPVANAGADQTITLPTNTATLSGSGTDADGQVVSYHWRQVSGPAGATISTAAQAQTTVTGLVQGTYRFELKVVDNQGAAGRDTVQLTVNGLPNVPPVANAGRDTVIFLPATTAHLRGNASDADGQIAAVQWTKISGPAAFTLTSQTLSTTVTGLTEGTYQFRLTVTDNHGATASDEVTVQVKRDTRRRSVATVHPNPAASFITVEVDAVTHVDKTTIQIHSNSGVLVHAESFNRSQQTATKTINIAHLQPGVYFLSLNTDINTKQTMKFIKQ